METLEYLTNEVSPRASGTEEELAAAEYLRDEFSALGYEASIQPFEVRSISPFGRLVDGRRAADDGHPGVSYVDDRGGSRHGGSRRRGQGAC